MIRAAPWILDRETRLVDWLAPDAKPTDRLVMQLVLAASSSPIWVVAATTPYLGIARVSEAASWAVADVAAVNVRKRSLHNFFPKTRAFVGRGGWRLAGTRIVSKFLGPVGVALLMVDAWYTGVWIGERLFGEMD